MGVEAVADTYERQKKVKTVPHFDAETRRTFHIFKVRFPVGRQLFSFQDLVASPPRASVAKPSMTAT